MNSQQFDGWTRRRFGVATGGLAIALLGLTRGQAYARQKGNAGQQVKQPLQAVGDSGVGGFALLVQKAAGTDILVQARGLQPGEQYVSLYYDNATCQLEDYEQADFLGDPYTANAAGIGHTRGHADDDLDEIGSVSVRLASDFSLQACATLGA
jgi:hypothetical protein